ncbi:MAG: YitT family protein, partial [Paenisporosarcina sp.]
TLILFFVFKLDPAIMNLVLNIPMFILGWRLLGRKVFVYTVVGTVSVSVFLKIFQIYEIDIHIKDDLFLASLFAGVFVGIGLGIIFRYGGTTGGVDIIARLGHKYLGWSMGKTMFIFDAIVILLSWLTFLDSRSMMYTLVAVFIGARVIDFVQEGAYAARGAFIISGFQNEIAERISTDMERGVTVLKGFGHFTKSDREVLYCVVGRNEIVRLKNIIISIDPHAFVSVTEVHDVMGEGFTLDGEKKPID